MKKIITVLFVAALAFLSGCATMGKPDYSANGTISKIGITQVEEKVPNIGGALIGATGGGVIGHQFGQGDGKTAMTVIGALVGAGVGGQINETIKLVNMYQITVMMEDHTVVTVNTKTSGLFIGQRINIEKFGETVNLNVAH